MRKLPVAGGATVRRFIKEMRAMATSLNPDLATPLTEAIDALNEATEHLLACDDPSDALAGATPYLRMFGIVLGGYHHARMMQQARTALDFPAEFNSAKQSTSCFYIRQIVPTATGMLPSVLAPATDLATIEPDLESRASR